MMPTKQWLFSCCIGQTNEIDVGTQQDGTQKVCMYIVHTIFFSNNGLGFTLLEYSGLLMWLMLTIYLNRGPDKLSYSFETMVQRFFHYIGKKSSNSKPIAHSHLTFTRYKTFPFFHLHSPTEPRVKFLKNFFLFLTILACEPTCLHTQQK